MDFDQSSTAKSSAWLKQPPHKTSHPSPGYDSMLSGVDGLLEEARRASARAVNTIMAATFWEIGRRIVEFEQGGETMARYGEELLVRLSADLSSRFGKGFSRQNLQRFREVNSNPDFVIWSFTRTENLQTGGEC